jgi:hypothetical protein
LIPSLGIADAYGGYTAEYHNALGFFVLSKLRIFIVSYVLSLTFSSSMGGFQSLFPAGQLRSVSSFHLHIPNTKS